MTQNISNGGKEVVPVKFRDGNSDFKISLMRAADGNQQIYGRIMCFKADSGPSSGGSNGNYHGTGFKITLLDLRHFRNQLQKLLQENPGNGGSFLVPNTEDQKAVRYGKHLEVINYVSPSSGISGIKLYCRNGYDFFLRHCMKKGCAYKLLDELNKMLDMSQKGNVKWTKMVIYDSLSDYGYLPEESKQEDYGFDVDNIEF